MQGKVSERIAHGASGDRARRFSLTPCEKLLHALPFIVVAILLISGFPKKICVAKIFWEEELPVLKL